MLVNKYSVFFFILLQSYCKKKKNMQRMMKAKNKIITNLNRVVQFREEVFFFQKQLRF